MITFTLDQFSDWYDRYRAQFLEPARVAAVKALEQVLARELNERDRIRVAVRPGRVKSKTRAWQKLNAKYAEEVETPEDIPRVMDDLVGLRIVCTNSSDQHRMIDLVAGLDIWTEGQEPVLAVHCADSSRDYLTKAKPSGYRAFHINLCTSVAWATERQVVVCELQVRTLLQDSWGELTHEDTYKPGSEPPVLVQTLSRRMADLMATLDDMAQDLRDALELITDAAESSEPVAPSAIQVPQADRDAAYRYLADRIQGLQRPIDVASLAWEMQREFGQGIVNGWVGHDTFKELVTAAVPDVTLISDPPGYVLPAGFSLDAYPAHAPTDVPRAATLLHETDKSFPLVDSDRWGAAYRALSDATSQLTWEGLPTPPVQNELTRTGRESAEVAGARVTRRHLNYIVRALLFTKDLRPNMTPADVHEVFRGWALARAGAFGLSQPELTELGEWLAPKT